MPLTGWSAEAGPLPIVEDLRIRELIPGQDKTVGYLKLHNPGDRPMVLVRAEADFARALEFHTTAMDGQIMRMRRLPTVELPPGSTIAFEPGGRHLMLFGVTSLEPDGELRFFLEDGSIISAPYRRIAIGAQ
jgi:copper(I)-binding protein